MKTNCLEPFGWLGEFPEVEILDGTTVGNRITFNLFIPYEGDIASAVITGTVVGDTLSAKTKIELNDEFREIEFKSERQK